MKILISTYLFVLVFGIIGFVSLEFVLMNRETNVARSFHELCIEKIENSYFDPGVIEDCRERAGGKGYTLTLEDSSEYIGAEKVPVFLVRLEYNVGIPMFGIERNAFIIGYAG